MEIFRRMSECFGKLLNRTVVVAGDSDNVAGLSVALNFSLYMAKLKNRPVIYIYRPIYFPAIFNRIKIHSLRKKHAIFDLTSPHIDNRKLFIFRFIIGHTVGIYCFLNFLFDLVRYKLKIIDQVRSYPRIIFGPRNLFNLELICTKTGFSPSEIIEDDFMIRLNRLNEQDCKSNSIKLGVSEKLFVCLHIRTMHYKGTMDQENKGFRNANPESYIPAIRYLISLGLNVVRLGDKVKNFLPEMNGYIDYANSEYKSEAMDIYLIKNCHFYLGTNSGIYDLAVLLRAPMLSVNVTEMLFSKPFRTNDVMIYKRIKRISDLNPLKMEEYLKMNTPPTLAEFEFIDNLPEDIIDAIDQILENLSGRRKVNDEIDDEFELILRRVPVRWSKITLPETSKNYMNNSDELARIISYQYYNGKIGRKFIRKYY